jgi:hypothetical protein
MLKSLYVRLAFPYFFLQSSGTLREGADCIHLPYQPITYDHCPISCGTVISEGSGEASRQSLSPLVTDTPLTLFPSRLGKSNLKDSRKSALFLLCLKIERKLS